MDLKEFLLLTLLNTFICLSLPRLLSWFGSFKTRQIEKFSDETTASSQPDLSNI